MRLTVTLTYSHRHDHVINRACVAEVKMNLVFPSSSSPTKRPVKSTVTNEQWDASWDSYQNYVNAR